MSSQLENLHLELFGALSEFLLANEVCWLWLSGCKRIQHLLEQGVTSFHHLPTRRRIYLWPSFISRFKRLQTASIASVSKWNPSKLYQGIVLTDIPNSITSLKLDFPNGLLSLLHPPSMDFDSYEISLSVMPLHILFPNLAHLEVFDAASVSEDDDNGLSSWDPILALPLSTLHLSGAITLPVAQFKHLSPTITSLECMVTPGNIDSFPPHLVELTVHNFHGTIDFSILPRTLRRLKFACRSEALIQCRNWPSELELLSIDHAGLRLSHADIKSLPNTLTSLNVFVLSMALASLYDLPPKLRYFSITGFQAFYTVSEEEWTQFDPSRLPTGLADETMDYFIEKTPHERLKTFPIGIRPSSRISRIVSLENIAPHLSVMADRLFELSWCCPKLEINWSFKNLKRLFFDECVHPGQTYLALPLLPLLENLTLALHIEDPSLVLNRIISPFLVRLSVNCHPLSLCKWDKRWLQHILFLRLQFASKAVDFDRASFLPFDDHHLNESLCDDISAMYNVDWNDWKQYGCIQTNQAGKKVLCIKWALYAPLLPPSLLEFYLSSSTYMENPFSQISSSEHVWPPRLREIDAFVPLHLWFCLPQELTTFNTQVESSNLVELATNLDRLPKGVNYISISFRNPASVKADRDLPIFTKLLQARPHLIQLVIGGASISLPPLTDELHPIAVTFGLAPEI